MLTPQAVFNLHRFADPNSSRYALGGVRFERDADGNPLAMACDGKILAIAGWPEPKADGTCVAGLSTAHKPDYETIVPVDACKQVVKFASPKSRFSDGCVLIGEPETNGKVPIVASDGVGIERIEPLAVEGRWPRWRDVLPDLHRQHRGLSIRLDAARLRDACDAALKIGVCDAAENRGITLTFAAGEDAWQKPVALTAASENGRGAIFVLMPIADDGPNPKATMPKWHPCPHARETMNDWPLPAEPPAEPVAAPPAEPQSAAAADPPAAAPAKPRRSRASTVAAKPADQPAASQPASPVAARRTRKPRTPKVAAQPAAAAASVDSPAEPPQSATLRLRDFGPAFSAWRGPAVTLDSRTLAMIR